jgi:hypothetical protein
VERESLRLLLSVTAWIQTDPLPNVAVSAVANTGLVPRDPFRRRAPTTRFRAFKPETTRYMNAHRSLRPIDHAS